MHSRKVEEERCLSLGWDLGCTSKDSMQPSHMPPVELSCQICAPHPPVNRQHWPACTFSPAIQVLRHSRTCARGGHEQTSHPFSKEGVIMHGCTQGRELGRPGKWFYFNVGCFKESEGTLEEERKLHQEHRVIYLAMPSKQSTQGFSPQCPDQLRSLYLPCHPAEGTFSGPNQTSQGLKNNEKSLLTLSLIFWKEEKLFSACIHHFLTQYQTFPSSEDKAKSTWCRAGQMVTNAHQPPHQLGFIVAWGRQQGSAWVVPFLLAIYHERNPDWL